MEAAFGGRQTKGIEKMNEGVKGCQVTRIREEGVQGRQPREIETKWAGFEE